MFRSRNKNIQTKFIFIIGSGRSGTHFLGRAIGNHPHVQLLLEEPRVFKLVQKVAILNKGGKYCDRLITKYTKILKKSNKPWILEKSHPNIWLTEELLRQFPDSYFIGMNRDVFQVVSSMLKHGKLKKKTGYEYLKYLISKKLRPNKPQNVTSWFNILPQNQPSKFLGINEHNISYYKDLPIEAKAVIRWLSHKYELLRLSKKYPDRVLIFEYSDFCLNPEYYLKLIGNITNLDHCNYMEEPNLRNLNKYKSLSTHQISVIKETLKKEEPNFKKLYDI